MHIKARYLMVGILLITLLLAAFSAPLMAQDTGDPAATEDPCIDILDAAIANLDTAAPDATEEPEVTACLGDLYTIATDTSDASDDASQDSPDTTGSDTANTTDQASQDIQATAEPSPTATRPPADTAASHSFSVQNSTNRVARFWLTWHVPQTGTLIALGSGNILAGNAGSLSIPSGAVAIGIRVEFNASNFGSDGGIWIATDSCHFAFADARQDRAIEIVDAGGFTCQVRTDLWIPGL
jgi:hypothetical protein